jgi:hypothetical protein
MKYCRICKIELTDENWATYHEVVGNRICRQCNNFQAREYRRNNPNSQPAYYRKSKYGITDAEFNSLLKNQNNVCAICRQSESKSRYKHLSVDHNHETGKIRGLLCSNCNTGIGLLKESTEILSSAIEYLSK